MGGQLISAAPQRWPPSGQFFPVASPPSQMRLSDRSCPMLPYRQCPPLKVAGLEIGTSCLWSVCAYSVRERAAPDTFKWGIFSSELLLRRHSLAHFNAHDADVA